MPLTPLFQGERTSRAVESELTEEIEKDDKDKDNDKDKYKSKDRKVIPFEM